MQPQPFFVRLSSGQQSLRLTARVRQRQPSDEYKVMGLAAYGEPVFADYLRKHVIKLLPGGRYEVDPYFIDYHLARKGIFRKTTTDIFGPPRKDETVNKQHADIAASAQVIIEESIFHIANHLHEKTKAEKLCLAGGVAFNCVVNGKLFKNTPFQEIFVQPAAGDSGSALGAALYGDMKNTARQRAFLMKSAYLGPSFSAAECEAALKDMNIPYEKLPEDLLLKKTAGELANGKLVCWFQGRMEWGPRALG